MGASAQRAATSRCSGVRMVHENSGRRTGRLAIQAAASGSIFTSMAWKRDAVRRRAQQSVDRGLPLRPRRHRSPVRWQRFDTGDQPARNFRGELAERGNERRIERHQGDGTGVGAGLLGNLLEEAGCAPARPHSSPRPAAAPCRPPGPGTRQSSGCGFSDPCSAASPRLAGDRAATGPVASIRRSSVASWNTKGVPSAADCRSHSMP